MKEIQRITKIENEEDCYCKECGSLIHNGVCLHIERGFEMYCWCCLPVEVVQDWERKRD